MVILAIDYDDCQVRCMKLVNGTTVDYDLIYCCFMTCYYEKMGFIANGEFSVTGMVSSFGASVDFDTLWMYVIESSVKRCFETIPFDVKFDCKIGLTPEYYQVMTCAYLQVSCTLLKVKSGVIMLNVAEFCSMSISCGSRNLQMGKVICREMLQSLLNWNQNETE